ncbi:MAG: hypothetical protein H7334_15640 [Ferruginibacter sp.]|nr:hypothetical protein [Ferruginibacter sp.]
MGGRRIIVRQSVADTIAAIAWFIESKGMVATAEKFADEAYDYFLKLAHAKKSYAICREPKRAFLGYKCVPYKKKYTIAFIENNQELIFCEFISTKLVTW